MKEEYKDFVGIYDESIPIQLCNDFVKNYKEAIKNRTLIDVSKVNETQVLDQVHSSIRKDEVAYIAPLFSTMYPIPPVNAYFVFLKQCFKCYIKKYNVQFDGPIFNNVFKIHKVKKTEGFHAWHYEKSGRHVDRIMTYMTYLEVPEKGGETEFLHQSLRIEPIVRRTLIWPGGFTHMHRGNPPLAGEKMYITGWFTTEPANTSAIGEL